ncbi:MAG: hydrolase [Bacteroidetes bacterium]|nr:MAG: hydrolase [Bacteroidota bacterium]
MKKESTINTIFTDIGGVLLTNGWDKNCRKRAIEKFGLDAEETEERHHLCFDTLEVGKITLEEYLNHVVFYKRRSFDLSHFWKFMREQSKILPGMIQLLHQLKKKYGIKIAVLSNEGRELAEYRIKEFKLHEFADFFIVSSFVHFRKPDADIFSIALDIAQTAPENVMYIEDRAMFVQVARSLGIHGIRYTDFAKTAEKLKEFGLK